MCAFYLQGTELRTNEDISKALILRGLTKQIVIKHKSSTRKK